jgi:hypothetical protein
MKRQFSKKGESMEVKSVSIRMPVDVLEWLRVSAAKETINRKTLVSINGYVVEVLRREMEAAQESEE